MKNKRGKKPGSWKGKQNPRWNNNASEYPNHDFLKKQRLRVLKRSSGNCEICNNRANIVHHIDGQKNNHQLNNLIALCFKCHIVLHREDGGHTHRTSKYIRKYGFTLKEMANFFKITPECLFYRLKNPQLKAEIEKKISGESNGASDGAGGGQASQNQ